MSETNWRTHRLELYDQTLREWDATVLDSGPDGIVLDTSAFYPGGGGQPPDQGVLLWGGVQTRIAGVRKGDDLYLVPAEGDPLVPGGNMEPYSARMDFDLPQVPDGFRGAVEAACNAEISAGRRIDVRVLPRQEAFDIPDIIRTATTRVPPDVKDVRIIDIAGLDQQADGGTHVATTSQIGKIQVVKIENKGKGFRRLRIRISD